MGRIPRYDEGAPDAPHFKGRSGRYGEYETDAVCDICQLSAVRSTRDLLHCPRWNYNHDKVESGQVLQFCGSKRICQREARNVQRADLHRPGRFYRCRNARLGAVRELRIGYRRREMTEHLNLELEWSGSGSMATITASPAMNRLSANANKPLQD